MIIEVNIKIIGAAIYLVSMAITGLLIENRTLLIPIWLSSIGFTMMVLN